MIFSHGPQGRSVFLWQRLSVYAIGQKYFIGAYFFNCKPIYFFAIGIWLVVWYLASHLSSMVRRRDLELTETNARLVAAQEERARHMLATTHQLKAPFAAIYSNAQLLLQGYCGDVPDEALQVIQRITSRSRRLTTEIQEMLQLANLSSTSQQSLPQTRMVSTE